MSDQPTNTGQARETRDPPLATLRDGAISVKLWQQEGQNGPFVTATIGRTYQDKQSGELREARSFSGNDLLKAQALLGRAHQEMIRWREHQKIVRGDAGRGRENEGLTAQRDSAMSQAKTPEPCGSGRERGPER